jgi:glutamate:Na+ symporter, ESS family
VHYGDTQADIDYFSFLHAILAIYVCGALDILAHQWLESTGLKLPLFVPCLLAGIVLTNLLPRVAPRVAWPSRTPALALIAEVSLGVFLAMSLMSMQLWALADLAGPLFVELSLQLVLALLFALLVVFRVLGRNYDAAVISAGFIGFGLGATPTAMANMTAVNPAARRLARRVPGRPAGRRVLHRSAEHGRHPPVPGGAVDRLWRVRSANSPRRCHGH